jgi:hypothetical protein
VTITRSIDLDEVLEGMKQFETMCAEHLQLLEEHKEALELMAPENPEDWPSFPQETFIGALRNILQGRLLSYELNDSLMDLLDLIGDELGFPRTADDQPRSWNSKTFLETVRQLVDAERESRNFRLAIAELLGVAPGDDVLPAVRRFIRASKAQTLANAGGGTLEKNLRRSLLMMASKLAAQPSTDFVLVPASVARDIVSNLQVIFNATTDL